MKQYNFFIFKIFNFCIAATLLCVACVSCDNIVDYNDNYSPADQIANNGAPVIKAVYVVLVKTKVMMIVCGKSFLIQLCVFRRMANALILNVLFIGRILFKRKVMNDG